MRTPAIAIVVSLLIGGCGGDSDGSATGAQTSGNQSNEQVNDSSTADGGATNQPVNVADGRSGTASCAINLIPASQRDEIGKAANLTFGPQQTLYFTDHRFRSLWQYSEDSGASRLHADSHDYRNLLGATSNAIYLIGRQYDGQPYSLYELSLTDSTWRAVPGTEGLSVQLNAGTVVGETVFFFVKSVNALDLWTYNQTDGVRTVTSGEQLSGDTTVLSDSLLYSELYVPGWGVDGNYRYNLGTGTVEQMEELSIADRFQLRTHHNGMSYIGFDGYRVLDTQGRELWNTAPVRAFKTSSYATDGNFIYTYRANTSDPNARDGVYELTRLNRNSDRVVLASSADRFGNLTLLDSGLYTVLKGTNGASLSRYTDEEGLTMIAMFQDIDAKTDRQLADPLFNANDRLYFTAEDTQGWSLWAVDTACNTG